MQSNLQYNLIDKEDSKKKIEIFDIDNEISPLFFFKPTCSQHFFSKNIWNIFKKKNQF